DLAAVEPRRCLEVELSISVKRRGVEGSNPFCSTNQSLDYRTFQRIERNPRVCARFAFACGPRAGRRCRKAPKFRESSLRAISPCPTPCDRRRAIGGSKRSGAGLSLFFRLQRV